MSHFQSEHPTPPQTDEYGNPVHHGVTGATTGTGYGTHGTGTAPGGHGVTTLPRSGSCSSSSDEDDGLGGRRKKKGLTQKIKEKLPGGANKDDQYGTPATATPYGGQHQDDPYGTTHTTATKPGHGTATGEHQEKGIMDKIKEKLPGGHSTTR
ncbi:hypothetical protein M0R45_004110 [Rubus argutus]|uniref:Dehydrin n=1 Tax=Rubus argutus TaxID=59490 RepID=A0AAW1YIU3_RUBAR